MAKFMFILAVFVFLFAIFASIEITSPFQQVVAGVAYAAAAMLFVGAAIVRSIDKLREEIRKKG